MATERSRSNSFAPVQPLAVIIFLCSLLQGFARSNDEMIEFVASRQQRWNTDVPHEVLAFYYPWYGTPERSGRWLHWNHVLPEQHEIGSATHYPARGPYDSHDPEIIDWHIRCAKTNGITGFISSWWGQNSFEDRAMPALLDCAGRQNFKVSVYWETAPRKGSAQIEHAIRDLVYLVSRYGTNRAFLKVNGSPVIFVYSRVMGQVPMDSWPAIVTGARAQAGDFLLIADGYETGYGRLFDGLHTYNIAGSIAGKNPALLRTFMASEYADAVGLARRFGRISCVTVIPGYDDTKIRKPGLKVDRFNGQTYRALWQEAIKANPDWVLITSWNEWHEGSEIEPSFEDGSKYLSLTHEFAPGFQNRSAVPVKSSAAPTPAKWKWLQRKFSGMKVGLLPDASGDVPFWLRLIGADVQRLTWEDIVEPARFSARQFPLVVFAGGEHYTGTVKQSDDVKSALIRYLGDGGFLVLAPTQPWPLYYDDSRGGKPFPITDDLGTPVVMGVERLPARGMRFRVNTNAMAGLSPSVPMAIGGDLRWRPCVPLKAREGDVYVPLVQLRDAQERFDGDGVAYIEHKTGPLSGGRTLYVWMRMSDVFGSEEFVPALLEFIADKLEPGRNSEN